MSTDGSIRICLFGKPALFVDGELRVFGGPRRAIALLAYLLLHRDRTVSRAALAEQFWPDESDEDARAALRRHLHRALAALPEAAGDTPWVLADKTTLRWNPAAPLELDTARYEALSADGRRAGAIELYRGDYVDDFYEDWIVVERERLRSLHASNLIALIDERRAALDYAGAIAFAQTLLRMDNLREDAVRRLMSLRYASGDRSGALADFETFSRRVREELDAEPMPETVALREAIRKDDLAVDHVAGPSLAPAATGFPFVGRADTLRTLKRAWENAARGHGATVLVSGEAGIGKTRLIGEVAASVESQGGRVVLGTTSVVEAEPYQPVVEALRGALPLLRFELLHPVKVAALSTLLPEVNAYTADAAPAPALDSERERYRLFDALGSAFEDIAAKRPLLAIFEDVHWASAATIELLDVLMRRLRTAPVLILLSAREDTDDENPAVRALFGRLDRRHSQHVALGPLDDDDVRRLSEAAGDASQDVARMLDVRGGGNPLFLTEILREHMRGDAAGGVPRTIGEMVSGRVARLSEAARTLLETAAVAGAGFDANVVRNVLGWTFSEAFDALDELLDCALVRESAQRRGDFLFSHQLVHAAVYDALAADAKVRLHRRTARTIERLFPDRPTLFAMLARHFATAGANVESLRYVLPAVQHALAVFSHDEAIALATLGLDLAEEKRMRFDLHRAREEAASRVGDATLQKADETAMRALATQLDDDVLLGVALRRSIARAMGHAEREDERAWIDELRSLAERTGAEEWRLEAALAEARCLYNLGDILGAEALLGATESLVGASGDDEIAFEYWSLRSFIVASVSLESAGVFLQKARARAGNSTALYVRYLRSACNLADRAGDIASLAQLAAELLERYTEIGDIEGQGLALHNLAISSWYTLDLAAQREHLRGALDAFRRSGRRSGMAAVLINRGVCAQHVGAFDAAERDYREARAIADGAARPALVGLCDADLASLATFRGDFPLARTLALAALPESSGQENRDVAVTALLALGVAERELGRPEQARAHLEAAQEMSRERDPRTVLEIAIDLIPTYLALSDTARALECAEELQRGLTPDRGIMQFPAHAMHAIASAFLAAGLPERAAAAQREAAALLEARVAAMPDEESRRGYAALPIHRGIGAPTL
jgi:DNA-binding SARP family transcriptional activator/tetratricopeptide (TPR) repeat protein